MLYQYYLLLYYLYYLFLKTTLWERYHHYLILLWELRSREVKKLAQSHTAHERQSQDSNQLSDLGIHAFEPAPTLLQRNPAPKLQGHFSLE